MDKLNPWRVGSATALTAAMINLICAVAVYMFPAATISFVSSWAHGFDLNILLSKTPLTFDGIADGIFNVMLTGFLIGVLFALFYNLVGFCPKCR